MSLYLFLNIAVIIIPFLLSFERKIEFYKKWKFLIPALLIVGSVYIGWDILSLRTEVWRFNREYTSGIEILGLPVEEILFFITVPYSCIFLYESLSFYLGRRIKYANFSGKQTVIPFIILISAAAAVFFSDQPYTFTVLLSISVFFLISYFFYREFLRSKNYWIFMALTFIPFTAVNYVLTSAPVVIYNSNAIWGIRILTIPLEDFIYSFSMLSFYLLLYTNFKKRRPA